jgi:dTDP-4-amino-4,6-dideoxygalactose transaminase
VSSTTTPQIPILDLSGEIEELWDELTAAIHGVLRSGHFIMGPNVKALEAELASFLGTKHALALNSGTDALVIGLRALGIGAGDEVITTPFTFFATAEAVSLVGATPVFVDIEPDTMNLDVAAVEAAITPRTRALIPVHLFGQAADMDPLMALAERHGLRVLEDVAQAIGARYRGRTVGTIGDMGAFSFFPTKNLGAYGDGGLIVTDDDALADVAGMLRVHGSRKKYYNEAVGYNSRLDEMQAAILRVKLPHLARNNELRAEAAARYGELLAGVAGVRTPVARPWARHIFHQYTIRVEDGRRDAVQAALAEAGIGTMVYYPVPVHRLPLYAPMGYSLPESEAAAREVLSLPIWPGIPGEVQEQVATAVRAALA